MKSRAHSPEDGFPYYYSLAQGEDLSQLFSSMSNFHWLNSLSEETSKLRYESGKWSIKQVVGHITDHERIKMFRAFQLSRNETLELWGCDQHFLVDNSRFDELTIQQLISDLENVRKASLSFVNTLSNKQLKTIGSARQYEITLEDFLKSIVGHERHHIRIIKEKYL